MSKQAKNNSYKQLVRDAKKRLSTNNYGEILGINSSGIRDKSYVVNSHLVAGEELYGYYKRIAEMRKSDEIDGAIGKLIDPALYEGMSPSQRERYVLVLSRLYRDLKEEIEKKESELSYNKY